MRKVILFFALGVCFLNWAAAICENRYSAAMLWLVFPAVVLAGNIIREVRA